MCTISRLKQHVTAGIGYPTLWVFMPVLVTILCYWSGLDSPFILDDHVNLSRLGGKNQSTDDFSRLYQFVFSGNSGPSGRPVAYLSFLINDYAWPSDPWSFKFTNLMLHCINGLLIFMLALKLSEYFSVDNSENWNLWVCGICASIWLMHPLQVSTVLYVVQRMTLLSTLFTLLGLLGYVYGRGLLLQHRLKGLITMSAAVSIWGILAVLCKENGILLLVYVAVIEFFLFSRKLNHSATMRVWMVCMVWFPLLLLVGYLIGHVAEFTAIYQNRPFSLAQRLMTEARVVVVYLYDIVVPKMDGLGLFHDDVEVSKSLLSPMTTLFSLGLIVLMGYFGWIYRYRYPVIGFGVAWFYGGHLLESTVIPLELYYEHRNYLPLFGITYIFAFYANTYIKKQKISRLSVMAVVLICCVFSAYQVQLWAQPNRSFPRWVTEHPRSVRAIKTAGTYFLSKGDIQAAQQVYWQGYEYSADAGLLIDMLVYDCYTRRDDRELAQRVVEVLPRANTAYYNTNSIVLFSRLILSGRCNAIDNAQLLELLEHITLKERLLSDQARYTVYYLQGNVYLKNGRIEAAMRAWDESFRYYKDINIPIQQAMLMLDAGQMTRAKHYINIAQTLNATLPRIHRQSERIERILRRIRT